MTTEVPSEVIRVPQKVEQFEFEDKNTSTKVQPASVEPPATTNPPPFQYLTGGRLYMYLCGLLLGLVCSGLDRAIVAVATPAISSEFNSVQDVGWYGSGYLLTLCAFQLPAGKLYVELNKKWCYLASLLIFEVGSIVCATATSSTALIIGRAVAGIGAAGLISGGIITTATVVSPSTRSSILGVTGAVTNLAQAFAPLIGGALVSNVSWRWCFWINLPCGAVTAATIFIALRVPPAPTREQGKSWYKSVLILLDKLDAQSTAVLVPSIVCLLLVLQLGGVSQPWNNWRCILLLCLFATTLAAWLWMQYTRGDRATVPPSIVRVRVVAFGCLYSVAAFGTSSVMIYYLPIWFQAVRGTSALNSGIYLLPLVLAWAFFLLGASQITSRTGFYLPQIILSCVLMPVMAGLIIRFDLQTSLAYWTITTFFYGAGVGLGILQPLLAIMSFLPGKEATLGLSLLFFTQYLSGTIMTSVGQNLFEQKLASYLPNDAPGVSLSVVLSAGNEDIVAKMSPIYTSTQVSGILTAYNASLDYVFVVALILACLAILGAVGMPWKKMYVKEKPKTAKPEER